MGTAIWSTTNSDSDLTFSESDRRCTKGSGGGTSVAFANKVLEPGTTWYWEVEIDSATTSPAAYGVAQIGISTTAQPGSADALGWSNEYNSTGRYHNGTQIGSQAPALSFVAKLVIRFQFNASTGQILTSYSNASPYTSVITWAGGAWRDLAYNTADHGGSTWDNSKAWYPVVSLSNNTASCLLNSTASTCRFPIPAGCQYLSEAPASIPTPDVPDAEFEAWLKSDADRVLLIEADFSTGEPDILGVTGDGLTVQSNGYTLLNDISNQPGNGAKGFGSSVGTIAFGEKKYFEIIPKKIVTALETYLGVAISGSLTPTVNTGGSADQFGLNPNGSQLLEGVLSTCDSCYDASVLSLSPRAFFKFDEATGLSSAVDSSGNNLDGLYNGVTLESAPISDTAIGASADFNGTSSYVEIDSLATDLNSSGIIAMVAVVNLDDTTGARQVSYIMSDVTDNTAFGVWITDGIVTVGGRSIGSDSLQTLSSAIPVSVGSTALIYASADYTSGELNLSVNGETILNSSVSFANGSVTTQSFGRIGQANNTLPVYLDGRIDGSAFFTTNLTQVDIDVLAACVGVTASESAKKLANPEGTITLDAGETGFSQSSTSTWNAIGIKNPQVSTGKYYWEMEFNGLFLSGNIQRFMGVSTVVPGTPIGYPGSSSDNNSGNLGVGWLLHLGRVYQNGGFTSGHVSVTDSTLLRGCCAFDVDTGKFWFGTVNKSTGATIWNGTGDPATGSNPDVTLTGGTYYVSFGGFNATANGTVSTLVSLPADYLATTIPTGFGSLS